MFARTLIGLCLVAAVGCSQSQLDVTRTFSLSPGDLRSIETSPQQKSQTLRVEFDSDRADVNVAAYPLHEAQDVEMVEKAWASKSPNRGLGHGIGRSGSFTAEVPENTTIRVVVWGARDKTEVKLRVTNR